MTVALVVAIALCGCTMNTTGKRRTTTVVDNSMPGLKITRALVCDTGDLTPDSVEVNGWVQGLAVWGDYLLVYHDGGQLVIFDKKRMEYVSTYMLPGNTSHCNNASVGVEKYSKGSLFPLIYVSDCSKTGECFVYDTYLDHAEEVQRFTLKEKNGTATGGNGWYIDAGRKKLCMHWDNVVRSYDIPSKEIKEKEFSSNEPDCTTGLMNVPRTHQGACEHKGLHLFPCGFTDEPTFLTIHDYDADLQWDYPLHTTTCRYEPEGICALAGEVYISFAVSERSALIYKYTIERKL